MPARPPCRPLAVRLAVGIADRPADGCFSRAAVCQPDRTADGGDRPYGCPPLRPLGGPPRSSAELSTRLSASAVRRADRKADGLFCPLGCLRGRPPGRPLRGRPPASSPLPAAPPLGSPPPPLPTILSTVEFQVSIRRAAQTPSVCFRTYISQEL